MSNQKLLHTPVMYKEVLEYLSPKPDDLILDCTIGTGAHAEKILEKIKPHGKLIGIDRDSESLEVARQRLLRFTEQFQLIHDDFRNIDKILKAQDIKEVDGMLFDLGLSLYQLQSGERGFSFKCEGPLDMRLDRDSYISAYDLINYLSEKEISSMLWMFGQERWHNRIAHRLIKERTKSPLITTVQLRDVVVKAIPQTRQTWRIHPATRTFQAVRIAVNRELEALEEVLEKSIYLLHPGASLVVIAFHSLEDRIVKEKFRKFAKQGMLEILTPKPLIPSLDEVEENPRSRSAKLRAGKRR